VNITASNESDQHGETDGSPAQRRGRREPDQADQEGSPSTNSHRVRDAASEEQQATERQGIGSDDPLAISV
jgi:hypothetical protein